MNVALKLAAFSICLWACVSMSAAEQQHGCPFLKQELRELACSAAPTPEKVKEIRDRGAAISPREVLGVAIAINSCGRGKQPEVIGAIEDTLRVACEPAPTSDSLHIVYFVAKPDLVSPGGLALLLWKIDGAVRITLDGQDVAASGERTVSALKANQTESLVAYDAAGRSEQRDVVLRIEPQVQAGADRSSADAPAAMPHAGQAPQSPAQWSIAGLTFGMSLDTIKGKLGSRFRFDLKLTAPNRDVLVASDGAAEAFVLNMAAGKLVYAQQWIFYPPSAEPDRLALASRLEQDYGEPTSPASSSGSANWFEWVADNGNQLLPSLRAPFDKCGFHTGGWQFLPLYAQRAERGGENIPYLGGAALDMPITLYPSCTRSLYAEEVLDPANNTLVHALSLQMIDPQPLVRVLRTSTQQH